MPNFASHSNVAAVSTSGIGLVIAARPSILPADGGTYNALVLEFENLTSKVAYIPSAPLTIFLASSNPQTGTVPSSIVFPSGSLFITANFSTTTLQGSTNVSAVAQGFLPGSLTMKTTTVGGMPTALEVFLTPDQILPDRKMNASVIVQAVDAFGSPVKLGNSITVTLSSSNSQVGSVSDSLVIPASKSFGEALFSPTYIAGQTVITASAANFAPGFATMTTVGPIPRRLVVTIAPSLISSSGDTATVSIQLQDNASQTPALAPVSVNVVLTSSNLTVAQLPTIKVIPAGSSYTSVTLTSGGLPGNATITASAQGYLKGSATVTARLPATRPKSLAIFFAPGTLLPDNQNYGGAVVAEMQGLNSKNQTAPSTNSTDVTVYARSSNNASMQVSTIAGVIPAGNTHVSFDINSTSLPGIGAITAQARNLSTDTEFLTSFGATPDGLKIAFAPPTLLSDGGTYQNIVVEIIDSNTDNPAKAPANTFVSLASSSSSAGQVQSIVEIPRGQTYARANFTTFGIAGSTLITASASNFASTNQTLTLVAKAATNLGLYAVPNSILANNRTYENVIIQLQNAAGKVEKTAVPVTVSLATLSTTTASITSQVTIPAGATFAPILINSTTHSGPINITAFATGFQSGSVSFQSTFLPDSAQLTPSAGAINFGGRATLTLYIHSGSIPLANATVVWPRVLGTFTPSSNSTNSSGIVTATYQAPSDPGLVQFYVRVSKIGYANATAVASITVLGQAKPTGPLAILSMKILFIPILYIIIPAVVAAVLVAVFFVRRRRSTEESVEEEE